MTKRFVTAGMIAVLAAALLLLAVSAWSGGVAGAQSSTPETSTPKGDNDQGDNDQGDNDQGGTTAENGGTVYSLTNDPERNQVVAYRRAADG
ncbi:MAG: hypothetical protein H0W55_15085, partial [Actinobacteria bacterium]|nr:hypothetical protein [Actinomycetota bacterium]